MDELADLLIMLQQPAEGALVTPPWLVLLCPQATTALTASRGNAGSMSGLGAIGSARATLLRDAKFCEVNSPR